MSVALIVAGLALAGVAHADDARPSFNIPAKPLSEALIDFAVQANVSVGGGAVCPGRGARLVGTYSLDEGLKRLMAGAACRYELVRDRAGRVVAIRISRAPAPRAPPPGPALARKAPPPRQADPSPAPQPAGDVVVTASRRPAALGGLPGGVSVVQGGQLVEAGATDTAGAGGFIAGFTTTNLGAARNKIMLRGLSDGAFTGRTQSTVATYLDDIPVNYNAPDPDLDLIDVQRVEVMRGPQGALFGSGSLSGVYRLVTNKPDPGAFSAEAGVLVAKTQGGSPSWETGGVINIPLAEVGGALRVVAYYGIDGGYINDVDLRLSNVDRTSHGGMRAALAVPLGSSWSVTLSAAGQNLESADTQYTTPDLGKLNRANQVREAHHNLFLETTAHISGSGPWGRLESSTGFINHLYGSRYDATAALTAFDEDARGVGIYEEQAHIARLIQDVTLSSPNSRGLTWLAGVFGSDSIEHSQAVLHARQGSNPSKLLYSEYRVDRRHELALYGELSMDLTDRWRLTAGARAFATEVHTNSDVQVSTTTQLRKLDQGAGFDGVSSKLSLQYSLPYSGMAYALVSDGARTGGFNSGGLGAPPANLRVFDPDHLYNYEIGYSAAPFDHRLTFRVAGFFDIWKHIQSDQYFSSGLSYTANIGDGRILGLEGEASWRPTPRLTLTVNGLLNRSRLTTPNPVLAALVTSGLPGVPAASAGTQVSWSHPVSPSATLLFTGQVSVIGKSRLTFDPRVSPSMGGYVTGRLSAQLVTPRWRLALALTNPFNTSGDTFAYGNPFSFGQVRQVTPLRPRTLSLSLSRAF